MARLQQETQAAVTTGTARSSGIPCAMVLTAYNALSRVNGLSCHPRLASFLRDLIPASRDQDHTPSPSAADAARRATPSASTASRPTFVTTRTPLWSRRDGRI